MHSGQLQWFTCQFKTFRGNFPDIEKEGQKNDNFARTELPRFAQLFYSFIYWNRAHEERSTPFAARAIIA